MKSIHRYSFKKFDQSNNKLYDTRKLRKEVDLEQWLKMIKTLRWYGPFGLDYGYAFATATDSGVIQGFCLTLRFHVN